MSTNNTLSIELIKKGDAPALLQIIENNCDRLLSTFPTTLSSVTNLETAETYVDTMLKRSIEGSFYYFMARIECEVVAVFMIKQIDLAQKRAEPAYFVDREHDGKGIATQGLQFMISYAQKQLELNTLFLRITPSNTASVKVAQKCGFLHTETLENNFQLGDGSWLDIMYFEKEL